MTQATQPPVDLVLLLPLFDDWEPASALLAEFSSARSSLPDRVHILFVNDGSREAPPPSFGQGVVDESTSLEVLDLARNLGHQRAIAVGLCHIHDSIDCAGIVVMDSDGQDSPGAIPRLVAAQPEGDRVVFASRKRRSEGIGFAILYHLYRMIHFLLTGIPVRFGNFSYLPSHLLSPLVVSSELWNHYAASVLVSRIPYSSIPVDRGVRLRGPSKMNFTALVAHGLGAFSVFETVVGTRILLGLGAVFLGTFLSFLVVIFIRLGTNLAIPGWATYASGLLVLLMIQVLGMAFFFAFQFIGSRSRTGVIPLRDYRWFVQGESPKCGEST